MKWNMPSIEVNIQGQRHEMEREAFALRHVSCNAPAQLRTECQTNSCALQASHDQLNKVSQRTSRSSKQKTQNGSVLASQTAVPAAAGSLLIANHISTHTHTLCFFGRNALDRKASFLLVPMCRSILDHNIFKMQMQHNRKC